MGYPSRPTAGSHSSRGQATCNGSQQQGPTVIGDAFANIHINPIGKGATCKMNFHADPSRFLRETSDVPTSVEGASLIIGRVTGNISAGEISEDGTLIMTFEPRWETTTSKPQAPVDTPHVGFRSEWRSAPQGYSLKSQYNHSAPATFPASGRGQTLGQAPAEASIQSRRG
ncbi:hypothetical protein BKA70DRAFT_1234083 [Coprinopsis sp. MPI-PUGE-AT-0042]|nr:hypothetical protein BKA70DRAFT_1234083 [Coprinopsis sp. MPI-PUGE-AT-0042]